MCTPPIDDDVLWTRSIVCGTAKCENSAKINVKTPLNVRKKSTLNVKTPLNVKKIYAKCEKKGPLNVKKYLR